MTQSEHTLPNHSSIMRVLVGTITSCFTVLAVMIVLTKAAYLFDLLPTVIAAAGIICLLILAGTIICFRNKLWDILINMTTYLDQKMTYRTALVILIALSIGTKVLSIAVFGIDSLVHPDIHTYVVTAQELISQGSAVTYATYCWSFPHMYWFAHFLMPIIAVFGTSHTVLALYLTLVSTASTLLLFDTARKYLPLSTSFLIFAVYTLLPAQILLPSYITHEHALMLFLSVTVWLVFKVIPGMAAEKKLWKAVLHALSSITLFLATQMNAAALVAVIALCIVYLVWGISMRTTRGIGCALAKCAALVLVVVIGGSLLTDYQESHSQLKENTIRTDRVVWTLYVGSNVETKGQWSNQDVERFEDLQELRSEDQIDQYRKDLLAVRYRDLFQNPSTLLALLKGKLSTIWSCFTYPLAYANELIPNVSLQNIYNRFLFKPLVCLEYGISVLLALFLVCSLSGNSRKPISPFMLFTQLYLLGNTAMLLLTECSNKYTIAIQPFFIIACLGMGVMGEYTKDARLK